MSQFRDRRSDDPPSERQGDPSTAIERGVWTTGRTAPVTATGRPAVPPPPRVVTATVKPVEGAAPLWRRVSLRRIGRVIFLTLFVFVFATLVQILAYRWIAPPTSMLMILQRVSGTPINRAWRPLDRISPNLLRAVIMSEDAGFCGHRGVDWKELARVYEQSLDGGPTGGGSTLSMQVTKNLFLWPSKSYVRKAVEVPLTLLADRWWGKPRMLEIYLNIAEWGPGIFGAEAAAHAYFKKSALELTESEAALLAVALPNPLQRNAANPSPLQRRLASTVQGRMKIGSSNVRCLVRVAS